MTSFRCLCDSCHKLFLSSELVTVASWAEDQTDMCHTCADHYGFIFPSSR